MRFLLYNPLVRLVGRLWWLPLLGLLISYGIGGEQGLRASAHSIGVGAAFLAGAAGVMALHGTWNVGCQKLRRRREKHRFLCPECLRFAPVQYACADCGLPLPESLLATRGLYGLYCPECDHPVMAEGQPTLQAYCIHCHRQGDRKRWHGHRVHAVAALLPEDYVRLCRKYGVANAQRDEELTWIVDEQTIYLLINLSACTLPDLLPADHALRHLDALWVSGADTDILALGQSADRFLRHLGGNAFANDKIPLMVEQSDCDPAVMNMLAARFASLTFAAQASALPESSEVFASPSENGVSESASETETQIHMNIRG